MLKIVIPAGECWDSTNEVFISKKESTTLSLEHSLVSISKWESKWHKPFLASEKKTNEEIIDYIKCMTITQNVDDTVYYFLTNENFKAVNSYIENPMTATTFSVYGQQKNMPTRKNEVLTSEVIYYWMVSYQIPFECQKWHLNRLITLIRVCNIKNNAGNQKMSKRDTMANNRMLNDARRKKLNTKG